MRYKFAVAVGTSCTTTTDKTSIDSGTRLTSSGEDARLETPWFGSVPGRTRCSRFRWCAWAVGPAKIPGGCFVSTVAQPHDTPTLRGVPIDDASLNVGDEGRVAVVITRKLGCGNHVA